MEEFGAPWSADCRLSRTGELGHVRAESDLFERRSSSRARINRRVGSALAALSRKKRDIRILEGRRISADAYFEIAGALCADGRVTVAVRRFPMGARASARGCDVAVIRANAKGASYHTAGPARSLIRSWVARTECPCRKTPPVWRPSLNTLKPAALRRWGRLRVHRRSRSSPACCNSRWRP